MIQYNSLDIQYYLTFAYRHSHRLRKNTGLIIIVTLPYDISISHKKERGKENTFFLYSLLIGVLTISRLKIICDRWRVRLLTNTFSQFRRALSS